MKDEGSNFHAWVKVTCKDTPHEPLFVFARRSMAQLQLLPVATWFQLFVLYYLQSCQSSVNCLSG